MPFRLLTLRKVLAVLGAVPLPAISGHGCPEKADLRPDGAWRPFACLPVSAAAVLRTAYACNPVSSRDGIPGPKAMILSELFQFLSFLHVMVTIDSRMCLSVLCFINVDSAVVITYYVKSRYRLLFWRAGRGTGEVLSCKEKGTKDMLKI